MFIECLKHRSMCLILNNFHPKDTSGNNMGTKFGLVNLCRQKNLTSALIGHGVSKMRLPYFLHYT
jgi:hypothetical protein